MKFNNRLLLMILVSAGQLVCLAVGLLWFSAWVGGGLLERMRGQVLADNLAVADSTVDMIRRMKVQGLKPGSTDWERLQRIVEQTKLPNDGFISIIEGEEGRVLCHPDLKENPILATMQPGQAILEGPGGGRRIIDAPRGEAAAQGWTHLHDGRHLLAVRALPELNIRVMAHQRERGIEQVISYLHASVWNVGMAVAAVLAGVTALVTSLIVQRYENKLARLNTGLEDQVERRSRSLMKTRDAVIFGLARLAESRHEDTGEHLERIRAYVEVLCRELARHNPAINEETINTIAIASSLHDIGKVGIPDEVLLKAGKLTPRQRAIMRRHTIIGGDCLLAIKRRLGVDDFLTTACQIALSHHERWNGGGYPFGLTGEQIPLPGRIVALADVYDALTSDRVYKCAMSHDKAKRMILAGAGKQFDPKVVDAFLRVEREFEKIGAESSGREPVRALAA